MNIKKSAVGGGRATLDVSFGFVGVFWVLEFFFLPYLFGVYRLLLCMKEIHPETFLVWVIFTEQMFYIILKPLKRLFLLCLSLVTRGLSLPLFSCLALLQRITNFMHTKETFEE